MTDYYLIKRMRQEKFLLGNGCWPEVFSKPTFELNHISRDEQSNANPLFMVMLNRFAPFSDLDITVGEYKKLANTIIDWANVDTIEIVKGNEVPKRFELVGKAFPEKKLPGTELLDSIEQKVRKEMYSISEHLENVKSIYEHKK